MKIQIDTENQIINVIGSVNINQLVEYMNIHDMKLSDWKLSEVISPTSKFLPYPPVSDKSYLDPPYVVTCGSANIANSPYCTAKTSGDIII